MTLSITLRNYLIPLFIIRRVSTFAVVVALAKKKELGKYQCFIE